MRPALIEETVRLDEPAAARVSRHEKGNQAHGQARRADPPGRPGGGGGHQAVLLSAARRRNAAPLGRLAAAHATLASVAPLAVSW
jgi:hypothetical protein